MNTKLNTIACVLLVAGVSLPVFAVTFAGTITQTVTESRSPHFEVGQTFYGFYEYDSPTIDGTFGTINYVTFTNSSALPTLRGSIFSFVIDPSRIDLADDHQFPAHSFVTHLTVSDGTVTEFRKTTQAGFSSFGFGLSSFNAEYSSAFHYVAGTMTFSDPVAVPEPTSTAALGAAAILLGIAARYGRRKV